MSMDSWEANLTQIPLAPETEERDEENHVSDKVNVRLFCFVNIWSYEDPEEASTLKWADDLIQKINQERARLSQKYHKTWVGFHRHYYYYYYFLPLYAV